MTAKWSPLDDGWIPLSEEEIDGLRPGLVASPVTDEVRWPVDLGKDRWEILTTMVATVDRLQRELTEYKTSAGYEDTRGPEAHDDEAQARVRRFLKALGRLSRKHGLYLDGQAGTINGDPCLRVRDIKSGAVLEDEIAFLETHEYVDD